MLQPIIIIITSITVTAVENKKQKKIICVFCKKIPLIINPWQFLIFKIWWIFSNLFGNLDEENLFDIGFNIQSLLFASVISRINFRLKFSIKGIWEDKKRVASSLWNEVYCWIHINFLTGTIQWVGRNKVLRCVIKV